MSSRKRSSGVNSGANANGSARKPAPIKSTPKLARKPAAAGSGSDSDSESKPRVSTVPVDPASLSANRKRRRTKPAAKLLDGAGSGDEEDEAEAEEDGTGGDESDERPSFLSPQRAGAGAAGVYQVSPIGGGVVNGVMTAALPIHPHHNHTHTHTHASLQPNAFKQSKPIVQSNVRSAKRNRTYPVHPQHPTHATHIPHPSQLVQTAPTAQIGGAASLHGLPLLPLPLLPLPPLPLPPLPVAVGAPPTASASQAHSRVVNVVS